MRQLLFCMLCLCVLSGCKGDSYTIEVGETRFNIPSGYILDKHYRMDGAKLPIVELRADIDQLEPLSAVPIYDKAPDLNLNEVEFGFVQLQKGAKFQDVPITMLKDSDAVLSQVSNLANGWHDVGAHQNTINKPQNISVLIQDGHIKVSIFCDAVQDLASAMCQARHTFKQSIHMFTSFYAQNLSWYKKQGYTKINKKIGRWVVKKVDKKQEAIEQSTYEIKVGDETFNIPRPYLLDDRYRKDGYYRFVSLRAQYEDLKPLDDHLEFDRNPSSRKEYAHIELHELPEGANPMLTFLTGRLQRSGDIKPPNFETLQDGLHSLGEYEYVGKKYKLFIYTQDQTLQASIECSVIPSTPNPSCTIYLPTMKQAYVKLLIDDDKLDWYSKTGFQEVVQVLNSWR